MKRGAIANTQVYHVFSRSIAGFNIFNDETEYDRMFQLIRYYRKANPDVKFSRFNTMIESQKHEVFESHKEKDDLVNIAAYCIMPTHIHLAVSQKNDNGLSIFLNNILNSYTRYFNTKHNRKGPLWESRFKCVPVESNEYLLHLTRYIHLNPVTSNLVNRPQDWKPSSYGEYIDITFEDMSFCQFRDLIDLKCAAYKDFVEDRINYQRELSTIKNLLVDE